MSPKVSICIPAYMQVEYLRKLLNSISEQNYSDYEIIIADDSPGNSVKDLLAEFNFNDKLSYFKNTPSLGTPSNWNFAMSKAKGEYIKLMHHDDFFTSRGSLGKFVKLLDDHPGASFAFSATEIFFLSSKIKKQHKCSENQLKKIKKDPGQLFFANYIGAPSATIIRKNSSVRYDPNLKWLVDIDYYICRLIENADVIRTDEPLICTVAGVEGQVTGSIINDKETQVREHVYLFNKLYPPVTNIKKYSLFFQLLFHKYDVKSAEELNRVYPVPENLKIFFSEVFEMKNVNIFFKKSFYWMNKMKFTDYLFALKKIFR